jgi:hypothetical protein
MLLLLVPDPTEIAMLPPDPDTDVPLPISKAQLEPALAVSVLNDLSHDQPAFPVLFVDTATFPKIVAMPTSNESHILAGKKLDFNELSNTTKQRTEKQKLRSKLKKQRWKERRRMKKANNDLNHFEYLRSYFQDSDDSEEEEVRVDDDPKRLTHVLQLIPMSHQPSPCLRLMKW